MSLTASQAGMSLMASQVCANLKYLEFNAEMNETVTKQMDFRDKRYQLLRTQTLTFPQVHALLVQQEPGF